MQCTLFRKAEFGAGSGADQVRNEKLRTVAGAEAATHMDCSVGRDTLSRGVTAHLTSRDRQHPQNLCSGVGLCFSSSTLHNGAPALYLVRGLLRAEVRPSTTRTLRSSRPIQGSGLRGACGSKFL